MTNSTPPETPDPFYKIIKKVWAPIAGTLSAILLANQFVDMWRGNSSQAAIITSIIAYLIWIFFWVWVGYGKTTLTFASNFGLPFEKNIPPRIYQKAARSLLVISVIGGLVGSVVLYNHRQAEISLREKKTIILLAAFDGPEEKYGIRKEIAEQLKLETTHDAQIEIDAIDEVVKSTQGSGYARKLGERYQADVVVWGWYQTTANPNITLHIENLSMATINSLEESAIIKPKADAAELESFKVQQEIGSEFSGLGSFLSGYSEYKAGNYGVALQFFEKALESDWLVNMVNNNDILFSVATNYMQLSQYDDAITIYDRIIKLDSNYSLAYYNRGLSFANIKNYKSAISDYNKAIDLSLINANVYRNRADAYANLKRYEQAVADYSQTIKIDSRDALAYYNRGLSYINLFEYEYAIADLNQVIALDPKNAKAYYHRGRAYEGLSNFNQALNDYNHAVELDPLLSKAYNNRGQAYASGGKYDLALADYNHALQINSEDNPDNANIYNNRGLAYAALMRYDEAIADYDRALQINTELAYVYRNRGLAYQALKRHIEAISDFDRSIELVPQSSSAHLARGNSYQALGQNEKALSDFEQALSLCGAEKDKCDAAQNSIDELSNK